MVLTHFMGCFLAPLETLKFIHMIYILWIDLCSRNPATVHCRQFLLLSQLGQPAGSAAAHWRRPNVHVCCAAAYLVKDRGETRTKKICSRKRPQFSADENLFGDQVFCSAIESLSCTCWHAPERRAEHQSMCACRGSTAPGQHLPA